MEKVIINDQFLNKIDAKIDINDRGYHFGDGVYEVIRVINGKLFFEKEHLRRFFSSAEKIKIKVPYSKEKLISFVNELVLLNKLNNGIVYFQITRGSTIRTHQFPPEIIQPVFTAFTSNAKVPTKEQEEGVKAITTKDIRWLRCDIKSLNLLPNVLAKQEAIDNGCFEAILHRDEIVTEASSTNVFIIKNEQIITHPATELILDGITRQFVINICKENKMKITEEVFTVKDLMSADEVFITSSTSDVIPIVEIDNLAIGKGQPGQMTKRIQDVFKENIFELFNKEIQV